MTSTPFSVTADAAEVQSEEVDGIASYTTEALFSGEIFPLKEAGVVIYIREAHASSSFRDNEIEGQSVVFCPHVTL